MTLIGITQRVDRIADYGETRDALDQRWFGFLRTAGLVPVALSNDGECVAELLARLPFSGFVLSGGNDLGGLPGAADTAPEREAVEHAVMEFASSRSLPVVGVCRGMQFINRFFGGALVACEGHVAVRHEVRISRGKAREVNSYHRFAVAEGDLPGALEVSARCKDGLIEGVRHKSLPIEGIMWHPEREAGFKREDIALFQRRFGCR